MRFSCGMAMMVDFSKRNKGYGTSLPASPSAPTCFPSLHLQAPTNCESPPTPIDTLFIEAVRLGCYQLKRGDFFLKNHKHSTTFARASFPFHPLTLPTSDIGTFADRQHTFLQSLGLIPRPTGGALCHMMEFSIVVGFAFTSLPPPALLSNNI